MYIKKQISIFQLVAMNWKSVGLLVVMVTAVTVTYLDLLHPHVSV